MKTSNKTLKIYLALLAIMLGALIPTISFAQCNGWVAVGPPGLSSSYAYYESMVFDKSGTPYLAFEDGGNSYKCSVMKFNGSAWVYVGTPGFTPNDAFYESLAIDPFGTLYVAYEDLANGDRCSVMKFNGTSWVNVGVPGFSSSYAYYESLVIDATGTPYVGFEDGGFSYHASVMKFNGTSWVYVGPPGFTTSYAYYESMALDGLGKPYIAFEDGGNGYHASVMTFNGTSWVNVGTPGFTSSYAYYESLVINKKTGSIYVAFEDGGNAYHASVMTYNGSSWVYVGSPGFTTSYSYYESLALDTAGTPYLAIEDGGNGYKCSVLKYNGTAWADLGNAGFSASNAYYQSLAIDPNQQIPYVAYEDAGNTSKATVMQFISFNITSQPVSANICAGANTSFSVTAVGNGVSYQWEVNTGSGFTNITNNAIYSGATTGTLTITGATPNMNGYQYLCNMGGGCTQSNTVTLTVYHPIITSIVSPANATVCQGELVQLSGQGGVSYSWTGGVTDAIPFVPPSSGTYIVTGTDSHGCTNTDTVAITVKSLPTITTNVYPSAIVCNGDQVTLSGNGGLSYSWSGGITNGTPFVPPATGTYTVTGYGANGCSNMATVGITVDKPYIASFASPSPVVCQGNAVTLNGTGGVSYTWSNSVADGVPFTPVSSGTYTVTGTDSLGCTNTNTIGVTVNPLPSITAAVSPSGTVCSGTSVTLNGYGAVNYSWTGGVTDGVPFSATFSSTYTVTGTDASGCSNTATIGITVNSLPVITIAGSTNLCEGSGTILTALGGNVYNWSNGGTHDSINIHPATTTTYSVMVTNTGNGCSDTASTTVTVNALPTITANASPSSNVCAGSPVTLFGSGANSYSWNGGVTNGVAFTPASSGTYTVTGTDSAGCKNTATIGIAVNSLPSISIFGNTNICNGSNTTLTAIGAGTYSWNTGGTHDTIVVQPPSNTTYTVTGTNISNGCSNTATVTVNVNSLPIVTANAYPSANICQGNDVTLSGNGAANYTWSGGVINGVPFVPASSSTYTVTGTDAIGCTNSSVITIGVNPLPVVTFASLGFSDSLCQGAGAFLLTGGKPSGGVYSGPWVSGGNTFNASGVGTYNITYTYTDVNGCYDSASHSITVNVCTGVPVISSSSGIDIYPNPANDNINIRFEQLFSGAIFITVTDMTGRELLAGNESVNTNIVPVNISSLPAGIYLLKFNYNNQARVFRFIKI
jgi:hypothetical protein